MLSVQPLKNKAPESCYFVYEISFITNQQLSCSVLLGKGMFRIYLKYHSTIYFGHVSLIFQWSLKHPSAGS